MEQRLRRIVVIFVVGVLSLSFRMEAADLIAILCCDTYAEGIEDAVFEDFKNMREEAHRIAINTGRTLKEVVFTGEDLYPEKIRVFLNGLSCHRNDIILFYFTGHGYRILEKEGNPWPNLYFSASQMGFDFDEVGKILMSKKPRFLLTIADCCNNFLEEKGISVKAFVFPKSMHHRVKKNYRRLFSECEGTIMIASSEAGQYSWCSSSGSCYTSAFIESLHEEVLKSKKVSWDALLGRATSSVSEYQTPVVFKILK